MTGNGYERNLMPKAPSATKCSTICQKCFVFVCSWGTQIAKLENRLYWQQKQITHCKPSSWWRHPMETFSVLLAICAGNSPVTGEAQRPVTWSFDVFFDLCLNKQLSKQWWGWWFEMPSSSLLHHCNDLADLEIQWPSSDSVLTESWICWFSSVSIIQYQFIDP